LPDRTASQQALACLLDCGVVWDLLQPDRSAQAGIVGKDGRDAAVVGLVELLEDQTDEQLRLRELPGAETMGVIRQGILADGQSCIRHLPW